MGRSLKDRFDAKVIVTPGCWLWTGTTNGEYGQIRVGQKMCRAHRISYEMYVGQIASSLVVCHKCDNPLCVNPDHLFLGTVADNCADMVNKGRSQQGQKHWKSRLTVEQILLIRNDVRTGKEIAADFGVSERQVLRIKDGTRWASIN